jgi:hypothetical protein
MFQFVAIENISHLMPSLNSQLLALYHIPISIKILRSILLKEKLLEIWKIKKIKVPV